MIELNGEQYYGLGEFAKKVNRCTVYIGDLCLYGNSIRKLRSIKIAGRVLIVASELQSFPFVAVGRPSRKRRADIQHFS